MNRENKRFGLVEAIFSFCIPAAVMIWVYASLGMAPWGDRTILVSDMSGQYIDFFCALKNGGLFFSWSKALGTGYIGVFSYYVSSPLSFLTLLVPNEAMPIGLMFLTVLKIALAGLSFCIFAQRRFPGCGIPALACAVCYALMSYNAAYSMCIMWLDGVIWLPLILLALERILAGRGAGPFIAALTVCFFSTWYISYMIGIFCVLYLCARLAVLRPRREALKAILTRFFGGAACALGLTAWMWLPTLLAMFAGKFNGDISPDYTGWMSCNPVLLLNQLLPGRYSSIDYSGQPNVFCGTAILLLVLLHFSFWEPYRREKLAERALLLILVLSIVLAPADKVWHLFQRPNWFPFRYAFLLSFFLLYLAVQALSNMLGKLRKRGGRWERAAALVMTVFAVVDMGLNMKGFTGSLQERYGSDSYQAYRDYYAANVQLVGGARADAGDRFFRMGSLLERGLNGPLSFGYPGITHYSSFYNHDVNSALKALGFAQSWYWCIYYGSTPATDALLDIEYVISPGELPGYEPVAQSGGLTLWKNPDVLPLAFVPVGEYPDMVRAAGKDALWSQDDLVSRLVGGDAGIFRAVPATIEWTEADETAFTFIGTGRPIYADLSAGGLKEVLVNGERVLTLGYNTVASVHYLGTPQPGEEWTVAVRHGLGWSGQLWELDQDALHAAVEKLDNVETISVEKNGRVRLKARVEEARPLLTTIPVEKGWTVYVDGEKVDTGTWLGAFIAVSLPAGEHEIELRYTAPGLVPGAALGALSLAGLALACWRKRKTQ